MADPVAVADDVAERDVEMEGGEDGDVEVVPSTAFNDGELPGDAEDPPQRVLFLDYLKSPIVQIAVGAGDARAVLSAHQDFLTKSPWFERRCADFTVGSDSGGGGVPQRLIELPEEDVDAVGMVLEYLYNGEYFPRLMAGGRADSSVEDDPAFPVPDNSGELLLRHARVYTLAEKFLLPALKSLAHLKIQRTVSTARGEISYARYVYANSSPTDSVMRKPVAAFWAQRSHVLRHEAEEEFRAMCLEHPQFGFDVLSMVLDQKEKKQHKGGPGDSPSVSVDAAKAAGRKRQRLSVT